MYQIYIGQHQGDIQEFITNIMQKSRKKGSPSCNTKPPEFIDRFISVYMHVTVKLVYKDRTLGTKGKWPLCTGDL